MTIFGKIILIFSVSAQVPAPSLSSVRQAIEKKDMERAVRDLKALYPAGLQKTADVERVSQWMSLFLFDETVALYEKAVELSSKKEMSAEDYFRKALLKEPHNKVLHQSLITHLIDQKKTNEALVVIDHAEKSYPYFKVFSLYRRYLVPIKLSSEESKKTIIKEQRLCMSTPLSAEAVDFCRFVLLREATGKKVKLDAKAMEDQKTILTPDALFSLWEMTSDTEYLKQYVTKCHGRTEQEKRADRLFPGVCSKVTDVEALLKTEDPED